MAEQPAIDFNRDIRPILSNHCFTCHGPDEEQRQANLRLDLREGAVADRGGYQIILPGDWEDSELIRRVTSDDRRQVMPPRDHGQPLEPDQIERLKRWIDQGAAYAPHWSYLPPTRPELPSIQAEQWPQNPIDYFILQRLEQAGLEPSAAADRYTLARRLSLDLTGLPPTLEQVEAFVHDTDPQAYEKLVDRLLDDQAYGERWASVWLDLARYADSSGYASDPLRTIWAYRDYVIRSLNENKPFDQFTIEQIAGDLLPEPAEEQLVATAFHRNTLTNTEGGTDDEEFRNAAVVDRVNTTMELWMGTTMACAQCHTHKYDPITHHEYFQLFDFFNHTADADRPDEQPTMALYNDEQTAQKAAWQQELTQLNEELEQATAADGLQKEQRRWENKLRQAEGNRLQGRFIRVEIPGRRAILSLAEVQVFRGEENLALEGEATQSSVAYDGPPQRAIDGNTDGHYSDAMSTTHTENEQDPWWQVDLGQTEAIERIVIWNRTDGSLGKRLYDFVVTVLDENRHVVWRQEVAEPPAPQVELVTAGAAAEILEIVKTDRDQRGSDQEAQIAAYYRLIAPKLQQLDAEIEKIQQQLDSMEPYTTVPVMQELPEDQRRTTRIHLRGSFLDLGDEVAAGVPEVWHPLPDEAARNRLTLARWLVDPANPLTARVIVNRFWQEIFGRGLVVTSEEFGSQGELPTHPELLDWLAVEFQESGWDIKHLLRLMVTSAAYRQESRETQPLREVDPFNALLSRGPRVRVTAEMVRDQALMASGLLSSKMYGPPVHPPRPRLGLRAAFGSTTDWEDSTGEDRFRRAVYTQWRRSLPYPSMATFDKPSREVCTVSRSRTNTPLQALVTMNDPVYVEASQALARRIVGEVPEEDVARRAAHGFRLCLSRPPEPAEIEPLVRLFKEARARFEQEPENAEAMATEPLGPAPPDSDLPELAAWTVVANVLLNLDEMFQKR